VAVAATAATGRPPHQEVLHHYGHRGVLSEQFLATECRHDADLASPDFLPLSDHSRKGEKLWKNLSIREQPLQDTEHTKQHGDHLAHTNDEKQSVLRIDQRDGHVVQNDCGQKAHEQVSGGLKCSRLLIVETQEYHHTPAHQREVLTLADKRTSE
jgi:hypothetical protein